MNSGNGERRRKRYELWRPFFCCCCWCWGNAGRSSRFISVDFMDVHRLAEHQLHLHAYHPVPCRPECRKADHGAAQKSHRRPNPYPPCRCLCFSFSDSTVIMFLASNRVVTSSIRLLVTGKRTSLKTDPMMWAKFLCGGSGTFAQSFRAIARETTRNGILTILQRQHASSNKQKEYGLTLVGFVTFLGRRNCIGTPKAFTGMAGSTHTESLVDRGRATFGSRLAGSSAGASCIGVLATRQTSAVCRDGVGGVCWPEPGNQELVSSKQQATH